MRFAIFEDTSTNFCLLWPRKFGKYARWRVSYYLGSNHDNIHNMHFDTTL